MRPTLVGLALALLAACNDGHDAPAPPSRAETGKTSASQGTNTDAFCDFHKRDDSGPLLQVPPVGEVKITGPANGHWLWLNVWATWCHPCIEEIPRITGWQKQLSNVDLQLISIDENDADVTAFEHAHPGLPRTARLADPKAQDVWFKQIGLDANAPIPIHVFVSPTGHVRCARAGAIREQDRSAIEKLLAE